MEKNIYLFLLFSHLNMNTENIIICMGQRKYLL